MKSRTLIAGNVAVLLLAALVAQAADQTARFVARPGSKMRIEGTSNIHNWQVESPFIGGWFQAGPGFPTEPGQSATPGKVDAKAQAFILVRSLKSIEKDGQPYSDKMDEIMYEKLRADKDPRIVYHLTGLTLKEAPKTKDAPYVYDSTGELAVAGVTNKVAFPVKVLPMGGKKLKISGATSLKMTAFKVEPPAPAIALGLIKTGDNVKLLFNWTVAQRTLPAAAAAK